MVLIVDVPIAERLDGERRRPVVALVTPAAITVMVATASTDPNASSSTTVTPPASQLLAYVAIVQRIGAHHPDVGVRRSSYQPALLLVQRRRVQRDWRRYATEQLGRFNLLQRRGRRQHTVTVRVPAQPIAVRHHTVQRTAGSDRVRHRCAERNGRLYTGWRLLRRIQRDQLVDLE